MAGKRERAEAARREQVVRSESEGLLEHPLGLRVVDGVAGLASALLVGEPEQRERLRRRRGSRGATAGASPRGSRCRRARIRRAPSRPPRPERRRLRAVAHRRRRREGRRRGAHRLLRPSRWLPPPRFASLQTSSLSLACSSWCGGPCGGPPHPLTYGVVGCRSPWLFVKPWWGSATYGNADW